MIKEITPEEAIEIIDKREPIGLFYFKEDGVYLGIDNNTGDSWMEQFNTKEECIAWLKEERLVNKNEVYRKALEAWGPEKQITMVFEEMSELQKELCKSLRGEKVTGNIAEEIADVEVMLEQMKLLYDIEGLVRSLKR